MSPTFDFTAQKRDNGYVLVARRYGVVVRSNDLISGIKELENRVDSVAAQFREAGVEPVEINSGKDEQNIWSELLPFFIKATIITLFFGGIVFATIALYANRISGFFERISLVGSAIEHPAQFVVRFADKIDKVSPERLEEWKLALHKIAAKVAPLVDEVRAVNASEQSSRPQGVQKDGRPKNQ
jgi:hypothetical protein